MIDARNEVKQDTNSVRNPLTLPHNETRLDKTKSPCYSSLMEDTMSEYNKYRYLVTDLRSYQLRCEPVVGYFETREDAQENADRRNSKVNDPYSMPRYIVFDTEDY